MPRGFSVYLDLMRLTAAVLVLLSHFGQLQFTGGQFNFPEHIGHAAVVIFFVLSGYVISYVARERERDFRDYATSRIARIYSVVLPAMVVTILVDLLQPGGQLSYHFQHFGRYLSLFLVFGSDYWFLNETTFSNAAFWSLSYEVPYYILFASWYYFTGLRRYLSAAVTLLIIGPRQWILFPLWLAGAAVSSWHRSHVIPRSQARIAFALSLTLLVVVIASQADLLLDNAFWDLFPPHATDFLRYSKYFAGDFLIGLLVALNLLAARYADLRFGIAAKPIVAGASCSFTLYLMHVPLLRFFNTQFGLTFLPLLGATLISVWLLSLVTENQKNHLRAFLRRTLFRARPVTENHPQIAAPTSATRTD